MAALKYVERGWTLLPLHSIAGGRCTCGRSDCDSPGKHPRTEHGLREASSDPAIVSAWWERWPDANIGCIPGRGGHVVIDIDGPEAEARAQALGLLAEPTIEVITGRGRHRWYRHPGGRIGNRRLGTGLDVRANAGYVLLPPSVHASGRIYEWAANPAIEPAVLPPAVIEMLLNGQAPRTAAFPVESTITEGTRNATLTSLAGTMRRRGMSEDSIAVALLEENRRRCAPPLPEREVRAIGASIGTKAPGDPIPGSDGRRVIRLREELNAVTNEAIAALQQAAAPVYVRSRMLVTVARDGSAEHRWLTRPPGSPVIVPLGPEQVQAMLDAAALWTKVGRSGEIPARPPAWVAAQVLRGRTEWPYGYLEAVTEVPTIRRDGTILTTPGLDEASGILYDPLPGTAWPPVPEQPSEADVARAREILLSPVTEFPFVAASDRAAYAAAVLTLLARHTISGPVPLFAVRAPAAATGKGLLVSVIAFVGTGRPAAVSSLTEEAAEWRKLLLTVAMEGAAMVLLDNLTGSLGSNHLAAALTATEWMDRRLGSNQVVRAPLTTVWFCTGSNLSFRRTLGRRVIPIDLDAKVERPEDRQFERDDLLGYVQSRRTELVTAGLTILRAFHVAGRPRHVEGSRMGSFEAWDDAIRSAVLWSGLDDPASTDEAKGRGRVRTQADEDAEQHGAVLQGLAATFGEDQGFTVRDVLDRIEGGEGGSLIEQRDGRLLRDAVLEAVPAGKGGAITARGLGSVLRDLRDRVVGGRVLRGQKQRGGAPMRWTISSVGL